MEHFPHCPHRNNKPADDCMWCATERGDDPFGNLRGQFFGNDVEPQQRQSAYNYLNTPKWRSRSTENTTEEGAEDRWLT